MERNITIHSTTYLLVPLRLLSRLLGGGLLCGLLLGLLLLGLLLLGLVGEEEGKVNLIDCYNVPKTT